MFAPDNVPETVRSAAKELAPKAFIITILSTLELFETEPDDILDSVELIPEYMLNDALYDVEDVPEVPLTRNATKLGTTYWKVWRLADVAEDVDDVAALTKYKVWYVMLFIDAVDTTCILFIKKLPPWKP